MKNKFIKKDVIGLIRKARMVARDNGREIAGLLIHNGHFLEILETRNISEKGGHFHFDERQINTIKKAVKELGHEIVGTFHSHPAYFAKPGDTDVKWAVDDSLMLIIDCMDREARLWRIKNGKAREVKMEIIAV
jgi:proteasome lid subunit RPN8/RPN11